VVLTDTRITVIAFRGFELDLLCWLLELGWGLVFQQRRKLRADASIFHLEGDAAWRAPAQCSGIGWLHLVGVMVIKL
jgi:hypothetical protein